MRPRFRPRSGPNAPRDGRPLELVRVRGAQRDAGAEGRNVGRGGRRPRRRGGSGRGPRQPARPPRRPSFLDWLKGLFGGAAPAPAARGRAGREAFGEQESRALADFGRQYGITFRDPTLLKLALTHRSYLHVTGQGPRDSNERLEFLGDSVLGLVTSEFLYRSHPGEHEGQLTKTKSLLVSKAILSRRALAMGLGRFVLMSHAEVESGGRQRLSILADAFESVIGAVYLDQGFEAARAFIQRWLLDESKVIAADRRHTNYKSHLQEYVQSTFRTHPIYRIRSEMGPDHSKQFMVEVMVGRRSLGEGRGPNKKEAEQAAARNALEAVESGPISDREKRRVERHVPRETGEVERATPVRAPEAPAGAVAEPDDEDDGDRGRRRRRGRRGGRGRTERPVGSGTAPPPPREAPEREPRPEPAPRGPRAGLADAPPRPSRFARTERDLAEQGAPMVRPAEVEPLPPAHEEDENEEVGRPEGPRGEPRLDPYAWGAPPAPATPTRASSAGREPVPVPPAEVEPAARREAAVAAELADEFTASESYAEPVPEGPEADEEPESFAPPTAREDAPEPPPRAEEDDDGGDEGPRYPETAPPAAPPPAPPPAPTWGRRGRRGR